MALFFANPPKMFVFKTRRDVFLVALVATALTAVVAHGIRGNVTSAPNAGKGWTGDLAVTVPFEAQRAEPMTSASLVVPKSQLALPLLPTKTVPRSRPACDDGAEARCVGRPIAAALPPRRPLTVIDGQIVPIASIPVVSLKIDEPKLASLKPNGPNPESKGFFNAINPLNHIPDMGAIGRPFAVAGDTVGGWFKRF